MYYEFDGDFPLEQSFFIDDVMSILIHELKMPEDVNVTFEVSENATGGCIELEKGEFSVEIPELETSELYELAAFVIHEMKHVEQYATGRLAQNNMWEGKQYKGSAYLNQPWEIEAFQFEVDLTQTIVDHVVR